MEYSFETILLCMAVSHLIMLAIVWSFMKKTIVSSEVEGLKSCIIELQKQVLKIKEGAFNDSRITRDAQNRAEEVNERLKYLTECVEGLVVAHSSLERRLAKIEADYNEQPASDKAVPTNEKTVYRVAPPQKKMPPQKPIITPR